MSYNTIKIKGDGVAKEATANAGLTPGHLIELMSTGKVRKHANAGRSAQTMFAVEDELQGNEISTDYSASNTVLYCVFREGDEVYAIIKDGEDIAIGDKLESAGNGELQEYTADSAGAVEYPSSMVAQAMEACDASDSATTSQANRRCRIEIM